VIRRFIDDFIASLIIDCVINTTRSKSLIPLALGELRIRVCLMILISIGVINLVIRLRICRIIGLSPLLLFKFIQSLNGAH
jgi:hypothetical protein